MNNTEIRRKYLLNSIRKLKIPQVLICLITPNYPILIKKIEKRLYFFKKVRPKIYETDTMLIHIPKVAGSSITNGIYGLGSWTHDTYVIFSKFFEKNDFEKFYKFSFVRNPYDRLFSAYSYLIKGGNNKADLYWSNKHLTKYSNFEEFVLNWVTKKNIESYIHFMPQYKFICDKNHKLAVDFVGAYETLEQDYIKLVRTLGFGDTLPKLNINKQKKHHTRRFSDHYSEEMKSITFECYKKDFELFNYSK